MSLPNPGQDAVPFTPLTAEFYDDTIENIEALAAGTGLDDGSVGPIKLDVDAIGHGFLEIGRTTLGTAGGTITVLNLPNRRYLKILVSCLDTGGTIGANLRFNNDSGTNYVYQNSDDFGARAAATGQTSIALDPAVNASPLFAEAAVVNHPSDEKQIHSTTVLADTAGSAAAPNSRELHGKWTNSSDTISRVDVINDGTGDFAIGSEVIILGHD